MLLFPSPCALLIVGRLSLGDDNAACLKAP